MENKDDYEDQVAKLKRTSSLYADESARASAQSVAKNNTARMSEIQARIVELCEIISDDDLSADSQEIQDLREIGVELNELGGFVLMKMTADSLAQKHAQQKLRTRKGWSYHIGQLCNGAWDGIGDWVA